MKIDAEVKMLRDREGLFNAGESAEVTFDLDYVSDFDDAVSEVEYELGNRYGVGLYNEVDFTIMNADSICEELESMSDENVG